MVIPHNPYPVNEPDLPTGAARTPRPLCVVTTQRHHYTVTALAEVLAEVGITLEKWSWDRFLTETDLPRATWVLTDFDRLHPWMLELAASRFDALTYAGLVVLNDPRRFVPRAALVRMLAAEGINSFTCWLPAFGERPLRFPVFLRTLAAHRGTLSDLLHNAQEADAALTAALAKGHPLIDLGFFEYRAQADPITGNFRKLAAYRVGDRVLRALTVNDTGWHAKTGVMGLASEAEYQTELSEMDDYPHAALIRRVTDLAGADYGRVDFGIVDGRVEIYEINSNPAVGFTDDHASPARREAGKRNKQALVAAFLRVTPEVADDGGNGPVNVRHLPKLTRDGP
ncbi:MAG: hypothetical protein U1D35_03875 [Paracoccaceae bacterium]|nr:hypothetical protein [Paracoccaceae bacterium]